MTYATSERFAPVLEDIGVEVVHYREGPSLEGIREALRIRQVFKRNCPDLLIYDDLDRWGTWFTKEMQNIPAIKFFVSFAHNEHFPISVGGWFPNSSLSDLPTSGNERNDPSDSFAHYVYNHICKCNLIFIPRFFQIHADTFDDRFHFLGPSISHRKFYGQWSFPSNKRNIVLISLGTVRNAQPDFYRMCIAALQDLDVQVVMSVGDGVSIAALQPIPANFEVRPFVPILDILPHSVAFIGHGGMNSTMEALYHGVPLLLAPQDKYQYLIATRVVELGFGTLLPQNLGRDTLINALTSLLANAKILSRVRNIGSEMRKNSTPEKAVEIIERHLQTEGHR